MLNVNGAIVQQYRFKEKEAINSTKESQRQVVILEV